MQFTGVGKVRMQDRRAALALLLEDPYVDDDANQAMLNGILDNYTNPGDRWTLWGDLRERWEWAEALEEGADPGRDDDGCPVDRDLLLQDVRAEIAGMLDRFSADARPAVVLPRAA